MDDDCEQLSLEFLLIALKLEYFLNGLHCCVILAKVNFYCVYIQYYKILICWFVKFCGFKIASKKMLFFTFKKKIVKIISFN